jgi:hypothetical protein
MEELYKILLVERENDSKRYWTIFNLMNIINAGLLAVITTQKDQNTYRDFAACFGILLCLFWFLAEVRMAGWIKLWEEKLKKIESTEAFNNFGSFVDNFTVFKERKNPYRFHFGFLKTRWVGWLLPALFGFTWLFIRFPCIPKSIPMLNYFVHL